jgi:hypothetical protein
MMHSERIGGGMELRFVSYSSRAFGIQMNTPEWNGWYRAGIVSGHKADHIKPDR